MRPLLEVEVEVSDAIELWITPDEEARTVPVSAFSLSALMRPDEEAVKFTLEAVPVSVRCPELEAVADNV